MAERGAAESRKHGEFRHCRNSGCDCTVQAEDACCSKHCENQASSAMLDGQGCECGHADCTRDKPPAA
jgi:hypothetical protein